MYACQEVNIDTQLKRKSTVVISAQNSKVTDNKETKIGLEINQHKATPASDNELRALVYSYSWVQMIRGGDLKGETRRDMRALPEK